MDHVVEWFNCIPRHFQDRLALFALTSLEPEAAFTTDPPLVPLIKYLSHHGGESKQKHFGKILSICMVIDFMLHFEGNPDFWEHAQYVTLEALESNVPKRVKSYLNQHLPDLPSLKQAAQEITVRWRTIRGGPLSFEALRAWEIAR